MRDADACFVATSVSTVWPAYLAALLAASDGDLLRHGCPQVQMDQAPRLTPKWLWMYQ